MLPAADATCWQMAGAPMLCRGWAHCHSIDPLSRCWHSHGLWSHPSAPPACTPGPAAPACRRLPVAPARAWRRPSGSHNGPTHPAERNVEAARGCETHPAPSQPPYLPARRGGCGWARHVAPRQRRPQHGIMAHAAVRRALALRRRRPARTAPRSAAVRGTAPRGTAVRSKHCSAPRLHVQADAPLPVLLWAKHTGEGGGVSRILQPRLRGASGVNPPTTPAGRCSHRPAPCLLPFNFCFPALLQAAPAPPGSTPCRWYLVPPPRLRSSFCNPAPNVPPTLQPPLPRAVEPLLQISAAADVACSDPPALRATQR